MTNEQEQEQDKSKTKQELKDKVYSLSKTVKEIKPHSREEAIAAVRRSIYIANINSLKEFLIDRNCQGERPELLVESPNINPETGLTEDRVYLPNDPKYNQEILDMLKKQQLIPDDSTKDDYDFVLRK